MYTLMWKKIFRQYIMSVVSLHGEEASMSAYVFKRSKSCPQGGWSEGVKD